MPAHVVIIDFFLMLIGLLLKTDAHIGAVAVKLTERQLDHPFQTVYDEEHHKQALQLLACVGLLMAFRHWGELCAFIFSNKYPRPQRQSHESLQRNILVIYYFQFHDVLTFNTSPSRFHDVLTFNTSPSRYTCPTITSLADVGQVPQINIL